MRITRSDTDQVFSDVFQISNGSPAIIFEKIVERDVTEQVNKTSVDFSLETFMPELINLRNDLQNKLSSIDAIITASSVPVTVTNIAQIQQVLRQLQQSVSVIATNQRGMAVWFRNVAGVLRLMIRKHINNFEESD